MPSIQKIIQLKSTSVSIFMSWIFKMFENFMKICCRQIFKNFLIIHKPCLGHTRPHKKFGPDRFSRFDDYWTQTNRHPNRQTPRQAKFIYRLALFVFNTRSSMIFFSKFCNIYQMNCCS